MFCRLRMLLHCFNTLYHQSPGCLMNTLYNVGVTAVRTEPRTSVSKPFKVKQLDRKAGTFEKLRKNFISYVFVLHFSRTAVKWSGYTHSLQRAPMW